METEKLQINLAPGCGHAEVVLREGAAVKLPDVLPPLPINISGTLPVVTEYLKKRVVVGEFAQSQCHILVNRERIMITLVVNETDARLKREITGRLALHPKYCEFGINAGQEWSPSELGMFLKMNRSFFKDRTANMQLVSTLMNFTATVNHKLEKNVSEKGDRTDNFSQVVNSNLPSSFNIEIPIFKGCSPVSIEVETFARIDGRNVSFILLSPGAQEILEETRDIAIDYELEQIRSIAPDIATTGVAG